MTTVSGFATRARPAALPSPHPRRCPHPPSSSAVADPVGIGRAGRCRTLAAVPRTGLFRVGGSSRLVPRGRGTRRWIVLGFQPRRTSRSGARRALGRTRFHAHLASGPLRPPQRHPRLLRNALWRHVGCQQDAHISSLAVVVHRSPLPQGPQGQPPSEGRQPRCRRFQARRTRQNFRNLTRRDFRKRQSQMGQKQLSVCLRKRTSISMSCAMPFRCRRIAIYRRAPCGLNTRTLHVARSRTRKHGV